ncbi:MAG: hypothetical protein EOP33_03975 [Rickettsiaceae bacterium]|nr:MAG: hypothetical protein EOP33_03975 [Rickettsiaceae bacterium]
MHIQSPIFPAIEIIIAYCFINGHGVKNIESCLYGLIIDQINLTPIGQSSFLLLCGNVFLLLVYKKLVSQRYVINLMIFPGYAVVIFTVKYLMLIDRNYLIAVSDVCLQLITTIIAYFIFKIISININFFSKKPK